MTRRRWGTHLNRSFDPEALTQEVAKRFAASAAFLAVQRDEDVLALTSVQYPDPQIAPALVLAFQARYRRDEKIAGRVWSTGRGILIPEVDTRALEESTHENARPFIRAAAPRSLMAVPVVQRGEVVGVLVACRDASAPTFSERDYEALLAIATRAGTPAATQANG